MSVANFEEAEAAVTEAFLAAFAEPPDGTGPLDPDTQIGRGTESFTWPDAETEDVAVWFTVYRTTPPRMVAQGPSGDDRIDCEVMLEVRQPDDGSGDLADSHTLTQLFVTTFRGADVEGCYFERAPSVGAPGQDGRWVTHICRAPFFFYETRS